MNWGATKGKYENSKPSMRKTPPMQYRIKINSFSVLRKSSFEKFEIGGFESQGYKWKVVLYPNGNKNEGGEKCLSLYLKIVDEGSLATGWKVEVILKLFLYNRSRDKFYIVEDEPGTIRHFHAAKTEWGFPHFISHDNVYNQRNGYFNSDADTCTFGVEVLVVGSIETDECLSMFKKHEPSSTYIWPIKGFSKLKEKFICSETFTSGGYKWNIKLFPKGYNDRSRSHLSLFLHLVDATSLPEGKQVFIIYKLHVKNEDPTKSITKELQHQFKDDIAWGWSDFTELDEFENPIKGFLVNNTCTVEAEVIVLGTLISMPGTKKKGKGKVGEE